MKIRILPRAERDLDEIWDFIASDDQEAATETIGAILAGLKMLAVFPSAGRDRSELHFGLRSWAVHYPYIAFYLLLKREVRIVRVIHGSRDIPALIDPMR